jgi:hypothetical protein
MNISLPHKALRIDFEAARDGDGAAWPRAAEADDRDVAKRDRIGGFNVRIDDGDQHEVVLVEDADGMLGYCNCDGFGFHGSGDRLPGNACAHLCLVRQMAVLDESLIPSTDRRFDVDAGGSAADQDDVDVSEAEVVDAGDDQEASADPPERADHAGDPTPSGEAPPTAQLDDPFAGSLEGVDDRFVMTLKGDPYIKREGWQRLARREGYRVDTEMRTWASDTDNELAEARARIIDEDGDVVATGTGTAYLPDEDLSGAAGNLNELAETRAISRAMGWATGAGLSAVEVDASAEYEGDRDVATDGGRK